MLGRVARIQQNFPQPNFWAHDAIKPDPFLIPVDVTRLNHVLALQMQWNLARGALFDVVIQTCFRYVSGGMTSGRNGADTGGSPSGRWWEYYLVRYFVGSVVGAAVVLFVAAHLAEQSSGLIKNFIASLILSASGGSTKSFIVIGAAGVAYCYIASSPMMILHTTRAQLVNAKTQTFTRSFYWLLTVALAVFGLIGVVSLLYRTPHTGLLVAALIYVAIVGCQASLIIMAHLDKFASGKNFYLDLGKARSTDHSRSEYVETYRHLREHSNAYAILVLELLLAFILTNARTMECLAAIIVVWLLPAVYCWFIATLLEVVFTHFQTTK
jgi:hypothetical protein